jgi:ADP-ribose pyrophosphatase YjhB (NUDIX family)
VLLVASQYPNQSEPLWNLPGGREQEGELLAETAVRECFEETGYRVRICELAYVSESYDRSDGVHFVNAAFAVELLDSKPPFGDAQDVLVSTKPTEGRESTKLAVTQDRDDDHVVEVEWVPVADVASRVVVPVVRDPLLAYLCGEMAQRYTGFADAGITIRWPSGSG